ncbi:MAG TPA: hypothetical protein VIJ36_10910, partial [Thermoanaerobaculia bacterium]
MKKMVLGASMILACLIFLVPPATAATAPHGAPVLSDFLASLAGPAPVNAAKRPAIRGEKSLCVVAANCAGGGSVSCSGNNSTTSCSGVDGNCSIYEPGHVTCDGQTTWCPNVCPPPPPDCGELEQECSWECNPCSYRFSCDPDTGDWNCRCILQGC